MDNASGVTFESVERMLHILQTESKELARFLVDEDITPPELIFPLVTAKVITTAHVQSILTLDHTTHDKYMCLLNDVETVIATSISNGFSNDTALIVKNFINTLQDYNLHRIAYRLHPELAESNSGSSASYAGNDPHLYSYNLLPNDPSEPSLRGTENGGPALTPSTTASAAAPSSSESNASFFTASSGDFASPHMRQSESCPAFENGQCGNPCRSGAVGSVPDVQAKGMDIVVDYNKKVFGPMDDEPSDDEKYRNSSKPRGLVFIANYSSFKDDVHTHRDGSDVDVRNLQSLFEKMGYVVDDIHPNLTKGDTLKALRHFRNDERHKKAHSCVVIIMSHGKDDSSFYTYDGLSLTTSEVLERFSNRECPALIDKPKLFILQYCRGDRKDMGVPPLAHVSRAFGETMQTDSAGLGKTRALSNKPTLTDMLVVYSTVEGYVSYRHPQHGSWLIKALCQVFMKYACNCNLDQLLKKVSKLVCDRESDDGRKQSCEHRHISFNKDFYFNPTATFDETRAPCVGRDGGSVVGSEANAAAAVGAAGLTNSSASVSSSTLVEDAVPSGVSSHGDESGKQAHDHSSNGIRKDCNSIQLNSDTNTEASSQLESPPDAFTFKQSVSALPPLPNNYDTILQACPGVLDYSFKQTGVDEEGSELDDSGITSNSSEFSSFGGAGYDSLSSLESNGFRRKSSSVMMTDPGRVGADCRQAERLYSSSSEGDVFLPPQCFIRRDSEVSVSLDMGVDDTDIDCLVLRSLEDSLVDA